MALSIEVDAERIRLHDAGYLLEGGRYPMGAVVVGNHSPGAVTKAANIGRVSQHKINAGGGCVA